jgi:hypothetical protein
LTGRAGMYIDWQTSSGCAGVGRIETAREQGGEVFIFPDIVKVFTKLPESGPAPVGGSVTLRGRR